MSYFADQLDLITAVTKALNGIPVNEHFYVYVELREEGTHRAVGRWSDEIGPADWYFEETDDPAIP